MPIGTDEGPAFHVSSQPFSLQSLPTTEACLSGRNFNLSASVDCIREGKVLPLRHCATPAFGLFISFHASGQLAASYCWRPFLSRRSGVHLEDTMKTHGMVNRIMTGSLPLRESGNQRITCEAKVFTHQNLMRTRI